MNNRQVLYLVGRIVSLNKPEHWAFEGIFDSAERAEAACLDICWFVAPVVVGQIPPKGTEPFPGAWFPKVPTPDPS